MQQLMIKMMFILANGTEFLQSLITHVDRFEKREGMRKANAMKGSGVNLKNRTTGFVNYFLLLLSQSITFSEAVKNVNLEINFYSACHSKHCNAFRGRFLQKFGFNGLSLFYHSYTTGKVHKVLFGQKFIEKL